ncbi:hypothetical protein HMPREF9700_00004 [Bergeyella zoohelcum CCUG 30536]|uniref:Uncharacterized protein n=2 Tax=Bergeyella zoohelcum TaxID=1015 RepID=A0A380ZSV1_9FLAO|nr:hypothetical protein HMPREF9700_00004 [Bergeyella zoohelcum CCUG 30536]SUV52413.1 Uncharacterised protein [Bergeyella zoohelcum]
MVGINYISTIAGNASHFITGKLMEMIDGDVHSETLNGREEVSDGRINIFAQSELEQHSLKSLKNNSSENSTSF